MALSRRALMANAAALGGLATVGACQRTPEATSDALGADDATGVAARIRNGEITASEALEAAIARAERVNGELNFIASPGHEYGRERAATQLSGPFAGVPTLIKDLAPLTGLPVKYGCRAFANNVATEQPPYIDAVLASGLVPFGKSTTPEFGLTATTEPLLGGATKNPWDTTRSCGGSSGGAAVAVAARVVPIAHASDGGGSIRIPASCNGLFGLKPSRGRNTPGRLPPTDFGISVNGCVSRSVRDSAAWLAAMEASGTNQQFEPVGLVEGANTQRLRIAVCVPDFRGRQPDADVRTAIEHVAELCRSLGHTVSEQSPLPGGDQFARDFVFIWSADAAQSVQSARAFAGENVDPTTILEPLTLQLAQQFMEQGGPGHLRDAFTSLRRFEAQYDALFENIDVLLTPVLSKPPLPLGEIAPTLGLEGFERVLDYVGYTPVQNVAGAPAMSVPLAWSPGGLPIGAHFSAAKGRERLLLELAYELETARPWADRVPGVNAG